MAEKRSILTIEQQNLTNEFVAAYNIEPSDVLFFDEKPNPFFTYEATSAICNQLTDLHEITVEPITSHFADTIAVKCVIVDSNRTRSAVGVANLYEKVNNEKLTDMQLLNLASARALRNALKAAGIDLVKAHNRAKASGDVAEISDADNNYRRSLIAASQQLGVEAGLIVGSDKSLFRKFVAGRFGGIESRKDLTDEQLNFLNAALNAYISAIGKQAA